MIYFTLLLLLDLLIKSNLTDGESFWSAGLEEVGEDGDKGQQTAGHDNADDIVERIAMNGQNERGTREHLTAAVQHLRLHYLHLYNSSTSLL